MRHILFFVLSCLFIVSQVGASENLKSSQDDYMDHRIVLGTVHFSEGVITLSPSAKETIDRLIPKLKQYDPSQKVVRIEGFASKSGQERKNIILSMSRAKAVVEYINENHDLEIDIYLSGFGSKDSLKIQNDQSCSAEIALYDNLWNDYELRSEENR